LLKKLRIENKEIITAKEIKKYCNQLELDYEATINHFLSRNHLTRIFRGIFYIKTLDEIKLGKIKYNHLELVAKGLEIKNRQPNEHTIQKELPELHFVPQTTDFEDNLIDHSPFKA